MRKFFDVLEAIGRDPIPFIFGAAAVMLGIILGIVLCAIFRGFV